MSVFKKAVTGFNHNIKHKGKLYHIQTEDSGVNNPHLITHLFVGGNILASKKTSYADIVNAENLAQVVRELMEEQHKEMLHNLLRGVYDEAEMGRSYAPGQLAPESKQPVPIPLTQVAQPAAPAPLPPEVIAARQLSNVRPMEGGETLFGEDLISEKSLDEVILAYLAGEGDPK
ncbi:MAG: hypothetical protein HY901_20160 [Deltaproteobacteria bacterium]|nr:hypothetical protein [Deltaproteobacteria bacterium]